MSSVIATTEVMPQPVITSSDTPVVAKEMKKRAPRRSKEEIAAEKEAKAKRQEEKAAKKKVADEKKAAAAAKKEARQAKMDAKPKMVDAEGNEIKKNQTAYFLFQATKREEVKSALEADGSAKVSLGDVAKKIGELWKSCSEEVKSDFNARAEQDKQRYETAVAANPENAFNMEAAKKFKTEAKKAQAQAKQDQKQEQVLREYQLDIIAELQKEPEAEVNSGSDGEEELEEGEIREDKVDTKESLQAQFAAAQAAAKNAQAAFARACVEVVRLEGLILEMKD